MLPGFRFLVTAIVLSMSVLVFGLGAAALLRAAHEQFASTPYWHAAPEGAFAQQTEIQKPVLSLLRVEDTAHTDHQPSLVIPATDALAGSDSVEQPALVPPHDVDTVAALQPPALDSPATSEAPASEDPPGETASAHDDEPADQIKNVLIADSAGETPTPSFAQGAAELPADRQTPAAPKPSGEPDSTKSEVANLNNPVAAVDAKPSAKALNAPDPAAIRKRLRARRAALRRRLLAERARQAQLAAQQLANPFAPPFPPPPALLPAPPRKATTAPVEQNRASARPL
jgi:hypothetical protein